MIEGVIGLVISVVAALIYRDFRLAGEPSTFKRIVAFAMGFPWSVIVLGTVEFGGERLDAPDDGSDLLEEIRREREHPRDPEGVEESRGRRPRHPSDPQSPEEDRGDTP